HLRRRPRTHRRVLLGSSPCRSALLHHGSHRPGRRRRSSWPHGLGSYPPPLPLTLSRRLPHQTRTNPSHAGRQASGQSPPLPVSNTPGGSNPPRHGNTPATPSRSLSSTLGGHTE